VKIENGPLGYADFLQRKINGAGREARSVDGHLNAPIAEKIEILLVSIDGTAAIVGDYETVGCSGDEQGDRK